MNEALIIYYCRP